MFSYFSASCIIISGLLKPSKYFSERDLNFLISEKSGDLFVLKISNSCETHEFMNVQNEALELVSKRIKKGKVPEVYLNINGKPIASTIAEAERLYNTTSIDALCVGDRLWIK